MVRPSLATLLDAIDSITSTQISTTISWRSPLSSKTWFCANFQDLSSQKKRVILFLDLRVITKILYLVFPRKKTLINLGIVNCVSWDDPQNLMSGKGRVHRHVNLQHVEQVCSHNIRDLMQEALQFAQQRDQ